MAKERPDRIAKQPDPAGTGTIRLNAADLGLEPAPAAEPELRGGTIQASAAELGLVPDTEAMMKGETAVAGSMSELLANMPPEKGSAAEKPKTTVPGAGSTKVNLESVGAKPAATRKGSRAETPGYTPRGGDAATVQASPAEMAKIRGDTKQAANLDAATVQATAEEMAKIRGDTRQAANLDAATVQASAEEMAKIRGETKQAANLSAAAAADTATVQASPDEMAKIIDDQRKKTDDMQTGDIATVQASAEQMGILRETEKRKAGDSRPPSTNHGVGSSTRGNLPKTDTTKGGVKVASQISTGSKIASAIGTDTRGADSKGGVKSSTVSDTKKKEIADDPLLEGIPDGPNGTKMIDNYQILYQLGKGGMGTVYFARDTVMRRDCAIKVLAPSAAASKEAVRRFEVEAAAAALIGREAPDNIVQVFSTGRIQQLYYLVMEYVDGGSLEDRLKDKKHFPEYDALTIMRTVCSVLDIGTQYNIIHRDLKPDNIMIARTKDGRETLKLADLGLAKFLEDDVKADESGGIMRGTVTGVFMGTPHYMSPEQMKDAKSVDHRADIYSLGIMFYRMLTGKLPFNHPEFRVLINQVMEQQIPDPRKISEGIEVSDACTFIVDKMTRKTKEERFQNYKELIELIDRRLQELEAKSKGALQKASPWAVRTTGFSASNTEFDAGARPATNFWKVPSGTRPATWVSVMAFMMVGIFGLLVYLDIIKLKNQEDRNADEASTVWSSPRISNSFGTIMLSVSGHTTSGMTPAEVAWVKSNYGWEVKDPPKVHEVDLGVYYISETEVSNEMFSRWTKTEKSYFQNRIVDSNFLKHWKVMVGPNDPVTNGTEPPTAIQNHPVVYVSLNDAKAFAAWLTTVENKAKRLPDGWAYRLPTEDEWELAARGADSLDVNKKLKGERRMFPWGTDFEQSYCFFGETVARHPLTNTSWFQWAMAYKQQNLVDGVVKPQLDAVESSGYKNGRSPYGCYHMAGNAWEWVSTTVDGKGVAKGGSWMSPAPQMLISQRLVVDPDKVMPDVGFRLVAAPAGKLGKAEETRPQQ